MLASKKFCLKELITFFSRYFSRAEDLAAALFLWPLPLSLLFTLFAVDIWDKHGIRVQTLCVSGLLAMAVIALSSRARSDFSQWLMTSSVIRRLLPIWVIWIILSGLFYRSFSYDGFEMGIISLSLVALSIPYLCYILPRLSERWVQRGFIILIYAILILEWIYLLMHSSLGVNHNFVNYLDDGLFRVFLNFRDSGVWAVGASVVALCVYLRSISPSMLSADLRFGSPELSYCLMLIPCWALGLITSGRGVFLSLSVGLLSLRLIAKVSLLWPRLVAINFLSFLFAFLVNSVALGTGASQVTHAVSRFAQKDVGRLTLWGGWFKSFAESPLSIVFGNGYNYYPVDYIITLHDRITLNPHNLYLQILHDSGLIGVGLIAFSFYLVIRSFGLQKLKDPEFVYAFSCFAVCSSTAALFDWPAGSWFCCLIPLITAFAPRNSCVGEPLAVHNSRLAAAFYGFCPWLFLFAFMLLQIPFVTARYVVFIPDWMRSASSFVSAAPLN